VTVRQADGTTETVPASHFRKPARQNKRNWSRGMTTERQAETIRRMAQMLGLEPVIPPRQYDAINEIHKLAALIEENAKRG
jgi:hypothetical protein